MKKRKYRNPPIVEVVCEFRFAETPEWDPTVPGLIYAELRDLFPVRRPLKQIDFAAQWQPSDTSLQSQWRVEESIRLLREDERAFAQLLPHQISLHHLTPYPHWEGFQPLLAKTWQAYSIVVPDAEIQRIGVRYINRIELPVADPILSDYFTLYPTVGPLLAESHTAFGLQLFFPFDNGRDAMHLRFVREESNNADDFVAILDFDYYVTQSAADIPDPMGWVGAAHERIRQGFEGCITDRLRLQFEEEVQ